MSSRGGPLVFIIEGRLQGACDCLALTVPSESPFAGGAWLEGVGVWLGSGCSHLRSSIAFPGHRVVKGSPLPLRSLMYSLSWDWLTAD